MLAIIKWFALYIGNVFIFFPASRPSDASSPSAGRPTSAIRLAACSQQWTRWSTVSLPSTLACNGRTTDGLAAWVSGWTSRLKKGGGRCYWQSVICKFWVEYFSSNIMCTYIDRLCGGIQNLRNKFGNSMNCGNVVVKSDKSDDIIMTIKRVVITAMILKLYSALINIIMYVHI